MNRKRTPTMQNDNNKRLFHVKDNKKEKFDKDFKCFYQIQPLKFCSKAGKEVVDVNHSDTD